MNCFHMISDKSDASVGKIVTNGTIVFSILNFFFDKLVQLAWISQKLTWNKRPY